MTRRRPNVSKRPVPARPPFPAAGVTLLGTAPDPEIAAQLGLSAYAVKLERNARRIAPYPPGRKVDAAREVSRTVKLTAAEAEAQDAALGDRPWASWAHDTLVAATPVPADPTGVQP